MKQLGQGLVGEEAAKIWATGFRLLCLCFLHCTKTQHTVGSQKDLTLAPVVSSELCKLTGSQQK